MRAKPSMPLLRNSNRSSQHSKKQARNSSPAWLCMAGGGGVPWATPPRLVRRSPHEAFGERFTLYQVTGKATQLDSFEENPYHGQRIRPQSFRFRIQPSLRKTRPESSPGLRLRSRPDPDLPDRRRLRLAANADRASWHRQERKVVILSAAKDPLLPDQVSVPSPHTRNGFRRFSSPIVVIGPCPGSTQVSSGRTISR